MSVGHSSELRHHPVFPNAACAVALIDRLTHHSEIIAIEGESYRKREAEQAQRRKQELKHVKDTSPAKARR